MSEKVFEVFGRVDDPDLYFAHHVANRIVRTNPDDNISVVFKQLMEVDYIIRMKELRKEIGGAYFTHNYGHCVRLNGEYVGYLMDLTKLAVDEYKVFDAEVANQLTFQGIAKTESENFCKSLPRPCVFLDFVSDDATGPSYGKVVVELFDDLCPNACNNFIKLCQGGSAGSGVAFNYQNVVVHRLVENGWLQCGDIVDGSGLNSVSSTGNPIEDECFSVDFGDEKGGILGYVSSGPHMNGSQFFITLGPCSFMNNNKVGFGRVLQGYDVLAQINTAPCRNQRPLPDISVGKCGKY
jgi:peptidyl-prolyl cis-trans isomerase-like 6